MKELNKEKREKINNLLKSMDEDRKKKNKRIFR